VCVRQINKSENFLLARVTPNKNRKTLTSGGGKKCNLIAKHTHTHTDTHAYTQKGVVLLLWLCFPRGVFRGSENGGRTFLLLACVRRAI